MNSPSHPGSPTAGSLKSPVRQPLVLVALAFASGILAGTRLANPMLLWLAAFAALAMAAAWFRSPQRFRGYVALVSALMALAGLGAWCVQARHGSISLPDMSRFADGREVMVNGWVTRDSIGREGRQSVDVEIEEIVEGDAGNNISRAVHAGLRLTIYQRDEKRSDRDRKTPTLRSAQDGAPVQRESLTLTARSARGEGGAPERIFVYGQRVRFPVKLRQPRNFRNPGAWDYRGYLADQGIVAVGSVALDKVEVLPGEAGSVWGRMRCRACRSVIAQIHKLWSSSSAEHTNNGHAKESREEEAGLFDAMLLGERSFLGRTTKTDWQRTGIYHMLVVSGLNVSILAGAIFVLLRRMRVGELIATGASVLVAAGYAYLADMGAPVVRAVLMLSIYLVARLLYRERNPLNTVAAAALVLLAADPRALFDASFQLTFLAVAAIAGIGVPLLERTSQPYRRALRYLDSTDYDLSLEPKLVQWRLDLRMIVGRIERVVKLFPTLTPRFARGEGGAPGISAQQTKTPTLRSAQDGAPVQRESLTLTSRFARGEGGAPERISEVTDQDSNTPTLSLPSGREKGGPPDARFARGEGGAPGISAQQTKTPTLRSAQDGAPVQRESPTLTARSARGEGGAPGRWITGATQMVIVAAIKAVIGAFDVLAISLVMQIALALPMAYYFHRATVVGLPTNTLAVPLTAVLMPAAALALALSYVWLPLAELPALVAGWCLKGILWSVATLGSLRVADMRVATPALLPALAAVAAFALAVATVRRRAWVAAAGMAALLGSAVWLVAVKPRPQIRAGVLEITAIDVGEAESLLVVTPEGRTLLVDAAGSLGPRSSEFDLGEDVISPYLWSRGITRLDALAVTHPHADHAGGAQSVIANFRPRELWVGPMELTPAMERAFAEAGRRGVEVIHRVGGDWFQFGGAEVHVLAPKADLPSSPRHKNDDSLVMKVSYGATSVLLEGDAEKNVERYLVHEDARADLLKVAHHGSKTSTAPELLRAVHPRYAVISAGAGNRFGHPRPEVLERLAAAHVIAYRTDTLGAMSFFLDGKTVVPEVELNH